MNRRKIIIDTDPGVDDSFAILCALADPNLEVLAIHTVAGNVPCSTTTRNALGLVKFAHAEVSVHAGSDGPLVVPAVFATAVHGISGLGSFEFTDEALAPLNAQNALESMVHILKNADEKVTIVALGPLTNLALFIRLYPQLLDKIDCISMMGGGIKGGNVTASAEFNFYADPHSAKIVFASGIPIIMSGLDVTEKARIFPEDIAAIRANNPKLGEFLKQISAQSFQFFVRQENRDSYAPNDACAIAALTRPDLYQTIEANIAIDAEEGLTRGMSIYDCRMRPHDGANCRVNIDVDQDRFCEYLIATLSALNCA